MCLQSIGIYHSGMTAYGCKIKTGFAFFNEVFHQPSLAVKFDEISYSDVLAKDLKVMDQTAITLCKDNDIDLCVFNMQEDGNIAKACDGQKIGTTISGGK